MKLLSILFTLFMFSLLSLFANKDPQNIYKKVILTLLIVLIALNVNIKLGIYSDKNIYVNILFFVLLVLNILIKKKAKSKNLRNIMLTINILNIIYLVQAVFLNIYDTHLFVYSLTTNIIVQLLILLFSKFEGHFNENFIISTIAALAFANFILGLLQYKTGKMFILGGVDGDIYYTEGISVVKRVVGFVGASNGAGNLGALLFPVVLYKFNNKKNVINLFYLGSVVIFTMLTLTRIAYVALTLQFLIFFIFQNNSKKGIGQKFLFTCLLAISAAVIYNLYFDYIFNLLFTARGNTQSVRIDQFLRVFNVFIKHPFLGVGAGQYSDFLLNILSMKDIAVHSQILNAFVEGGIIGGIAYLFFNLRLIIMAMKNCNKEGLWFVIALVIGNLVVSNFNPNQYYAINIFLYYFILCGIIFAARGENEKIIDYK